MLLKVLMAALGAVAGLLYQRNVGCTSGGCPITSDPWISTLYGAVDAAHIQQSYGAEELLPLINDLVTRSKVA